MAQQGHDGRMFKGNNENIATFIMNLHMLVRTCVVNEHSPKYVGLTKFQEMLQYIA